MIIKYELFDLWWLSGLIMVNIIFYLESSTWIHYFGLNLVAIITMLGVGILRCEWYEAVVDKVHKVKWK